MELAFFFLHTFGNADLFLYQIYMHRRPRALAGGTEFSSQSSLVHLGLDDFNVKKKDVHIESVLSINQVTLN